MLRPANPVPNPTPNIMPNAPNPNANINIHMIVYERRELNVAMVTRGCAMIGADQATQTYPTTHAQPQVRPATKKKAPIDIQEQKHIFMDVCPDFIGAEQPYTSSQVKYMSERFQKIFEQ